MQKPQRLQKLLAAAGLGSRRAIEQWIRDGRVTIGGRPAQLGDRAMPGDDLRLDGRRLRLVAEAPSAHELLLYHKPLGEVTTRSDPQGRPTVFDRLPPPRQGRWIVIGRLDVNTSGLLLFTTDGELAHRLMHPSTEVEREYRVRVRGTPSPQVVRKLLEGVRLEDGPARFDRITPEPAPGPIAGRTGSSDRIRDRGRDHGGGPAQAHGWYRVVLHEGRNREVRRLWAAVGFEVSRLVRIRYGGLGLPDALRPGTWRRATPAEVERLAGTLVATAPRTGGSAMQVLVSSDHSITSSEDLVARITGAVTDGLDRFTDRITRVQVHLSDVNSHKLGKADKHCTLEAHLGGLKPIAVHSDAADITAAVDGAVDKLWRALDHELGRLEDTPGRAPADREIATTQELENLERRHRH